MSLADDVEYGEDGLLPVAVTDHTSNRLLVLCFLNREALEKTIAEGLVHVYRRSKGAPSNQPLFDAATAPLPGFAPKQGFMF